MTEATVRVMFVCLGNICRSPTAHGVFRHMVAEAGLDDRIEIASSGTGDWHIGKPPDQRAASAALKRQIDIDDLRAQQVTADDLRAFDYVLAMDADNLASLQTLYQATADARAEPSLFMRYSTAYRDQSVPDPYFGGEQGFERVLDMIEDASSGLLADIRQRWPDLD
ncbi:low molecular weight protein-tyrosine-phosphatase [Salinisphaera sp.]|uniref:low molecular weight protein-tyrosine-phosphatase n=1 Tax=Salinisphaera sp. TaxID=1914330 RepID=UPI000C36E676|nr:low molecular weight protein-tyrosine-phosphatase [Salinisphaera sp.]MBS62753.1 phosphotyrosine protein phosphatase [Salinisphaera sp.]